MVNNNYIKMGQGEYVVFHELLNKEKKELSRDIFEKVYPLLLEFIPAIMMSQEKDKKVAEDKCAQRYDLLRDKIKAIEPSLEIAFIPKTLYELFFIRKHINTELKHPDGDAGCWSFHSIAETGDPLNDPTIKELAYRLNKTISKNLSPTSKGFTLQELTQFTDRKIEYLKDYYDKCSEIYQRMMKYMTITEAEYPYSSIRQSFGFEEFRGSKSLGVRDSADGEIIRKAVCLDCSKEAQASVILYRGSKFKADSVIDNDAPYSLSYATGIFAGCVYDSGAASFHHMRSSKKDAYAIPLPFSQISESVFYIPPTNTICQLYGGGEFFHARTKAWKEYNIRFLQGIQDGATGLRDRPAYLSSLISKDDLIKQFETYKNKALQLK